MPEINLLPQDLLPKESVVRSAGVLKQFGVAGAILLTLSATALIGYFFFISTQLNASISAQEDLKTSISSLETTEQQLFLVKDRLKYISEVVGENAAITTVSKVSDIRASIPAEVSLIETEIAEDRLEIVMVTSSAGSFSTTLARILSLELYNKVSLVSFGYNPVSGYVANLSFLD